MIQLSHAAADEIRRLKSKQHPNVLFRLAVKPGGCSGWYYDMSFNAALQSADGAEEPPQGGALVFDSQGIQVVIDAESLQYINGMTLDYSEDLMGGGFRFYNPQANATCGCGNSFSTTHRT
ncbi:HesB/IscA family protein [Mastigocladopsis repens]|uniref:HesB/IscA family protein n=1 Tax=Mastigocladopsis repens TaxID=221287 RepID=UPI000365161D|nr:iron-sulfur cluster assembly accessory protein [Mastigocladopsis repens]